MSLFRNLTRNLLRSGRIMLNSDSHLCQSHNVLCAIGTNSTSNKTVCEIFSHHSGSKQERNHMPSIFCRGYRILCSCLKLEKPFQSTLWKMETSRLLTPSLVWSNHVCGYKVKRLLRKRCRHCYFEKRKGRWYIECTAKPRHKQMEKMPRYKVFSED